MNWKNSTLRTFGRISSTWDQVKSFTADHPLEAFPLRTTLRGYTRDDARSDTRAGLDGALMAVPQGMAFAVVAGLPLYYGITCSAVACVVGAFLMSARHSIYGPTNATAFMVASFFYVYPEIDRIAVMPMLVFMVGALLVLGAYCRIADMAQYISRTVVVAYLTGAAVQMFVHQLPVIMGVDLMAGGTRAHSGSLFSELIHLVVNLWRSHWLTVGISVLTLITYFGIRRLGRRWPALALTLIFSGLVVFILQKFGIHVATYADATFKWRDILPPFPDFTGGNASTQFSQLFGLALSLAFVTTLENSAMARTLASKAGHRVDSNQDMLSLGVANLACAYLSGMPASHSLTRSMAAYESGAVSPVSAIISGVVCLGASLMMGPLVAYIPRCALGVLVMCVAGALIQPRLIRICFRATRSDAFVFLVTFIATLMVPLHVAIFTGIGLSVMLYLRKASQPSLVEYEFNKEGNLAESQSKTRQNASISIVHVEGDLFFGAAELFRTQIQRTCSDPNLRIIILRLKNARHLDATSVMALEELIKVMRENGRDLIVSGAMKDVYRVLKNSGLIETIGRENLFMGSAANPNISTRNALKRAQEILGVKYADINIYYDPRHQAGSGI